MDFFTEILLDVLKGAVTSGFTAVLFYVWAVRARKLAAQKVNVVFVSPLGEIYNPGVAIRRDETTRAEVLGRTGAAVGGQAAGVALPGLDQRELDEVKAGKRSLLSLCFADEAMFSKAKTAVEICQGRQVRPETKKAPPPITRDDLAALKQEVSAEVERVLSAVRAHTMILSDVCPVPAIRKIERANGRRR